MKKNQIITSLLCLCSLFLNAQISIKGNISDSQTKAPLSYASIAVPNSGTGSMTNAKGDFELQLKENQTQIQVSFVGYIDTLITIDEEIENYKIQLEPYTFGLTEIIVTSLTPLEYIQKALEKHPSLIPDKPFETRSFFASKSSLKNDDSSSYNLDQAVYQTYFAEYANDTLDENSQLLLHRSISEGDFKSILYKNKRLQKMSGEDSDETAQDTSLNISVNDLTGVGPSSVILESKSITSLDFFNSEYFKKFAYTFGEQTFYQGRELIKIDFSNKRKVEQSFYIGSVYLDHTDLSIVAVDYTQEAKIPFYINALLKTVVGFTIPELTKRTKIRNQNLNDRWYPKEVVYDLDLSLKQKGEIEVISMEVLLNIEKIDYQNPMQIEQDKIFDKEKDFEEQVFPIENINWEEVNIIKIEDN